MATLLGIDISKNNFVVSKRKSEKTFEFFTHSNNDASICAFLASCSKDTHLVMEYTGNYEKLLAHAALKAQLRVSIVPGAHIRYFAKMKGSTVKSDKEDAKNILRFSEKEQENLADYTPPSQEVSDMKQLRKLLSDTKKSLQAHKNRLESFMLNPTVNKFVQDKLEAKVAEEEQSVVEIEAEIKRLGSTQGEAEGQFNPKIPMSVMGVGPVTAAELTLFAASFRGFEKENISKMIKLIGLAPSVYESGTSVRGSRKVSRAGFAKLRNALYMGAGSAVRAKKDNPFKSFFEELRREGKPYKVAIMAVMRRIATVALTCMITGEKYDLERHKKATGK